MSLEKFYKTIQKNGQTFSLKKNRQKILSFSLSKIQAIKTYLPLKMKDGECSRKMSRVRLGL